LAQQAQNAAAAAHAQVEAARSRLQQPMPQVPAFPTAPTISSRPASTQQGRAVPIAVEQVQTSTPRQQPSRSSTPSLQRTSSVSNVVSQDRPQLQAGAASRSSTPCLQRPRRTSSLANPAVSTPAVSPVKGAQARASSSSPMSQQAVSSYSPAPQRIPVHASPMPQRNSYVPPQSNQPVRQSSYTPVPQMSNLGCTYTGGGMSAAPLPGLPSSGLGPGMLASTALATAQQLVLEGAAITGAELMQFQQPQASVACATMNPPAAFPSFGDSLLGSTPGSAVNRQQSLHRSTKQLHQSQGQLSWVGGNVPLPQNQWLQQGPQALQHHQSQMSLTPVLQQPVQQLAHGFQWPLGNQFQNFAGI